MLRSSLLALAGFAALASAKTSRAAASSDADVLNNLLAIEQASAAFYKRADQYFVAEDYTDLGIRAQIMDRHAAWAFDDAQHVTMLTSAVKSAGGSPNAACTYSFSYIHAPQFLAISRSLDGMAVSAYIGAVGALSSADVRQMAASILSNKARRVGLTNEIFGFSGIPRSIDTALTSTQAASALATYVSKCPSGNDTPFTAFPTLSVSTASSKVAAGKSITVKSSKLGSYLHILSGDDDTAVALSSSGVATLPSGLAGRIYLLTSNSKTLSDSNTVSGPAIVDLPDVKPSRLFALGKQAVSWASMS